MISAELRSCDNQSLTTSSGQSDRCGNPFCNSSIEPLPDGYRRTARRYCSDQCKMDGYVLRKAKEMIDRVGIVKFNAILEGL